MRYPRSHVSSYAMPPSTHSSKARRLYRHTVCAPRHTRSGDSGESAIDSGVFGTARSSVTMDCGGVAGRISTEEKPGPERLRSAGYVAGGKAIMSCAACSASDEIRTCEWAD